MGFSWDSPIPKRLRWLNRWRWVQHHWVSWGLLGGISALIGAQVLSIAFQLLFHEEPAAWKLGILLLLTLAIPGGLQFLPGKFSLLGGFPGRIPILGIRLVWGPPMVQAFLLQELRRISFWLSVVGVGISVYWVPSSFYKAWVWVALVIPLRVIFSFSEWKSLFRAHGPRTGVMDGARAAGLVTLIGLVIAFGIAWGGTHFLGGPREGPAFGWEIGVGALSAAAGALFMMWEGDSGRPWLVHGMALGIGILSGIAGLAHWLSLLFIVYVGLQHLAAVPGRLRSLEHADEDSLL
jgi:hypothetical protein